MQERWRDKVAGIQRESQLAGETVGGEKLIMYELSWLVILSEKGALSLTRGKNECKLIFECSFPIFLLLLFHEKMWHMKFSSKNWLDTQLVERNQRTLCRKWNFWDQKETTVTLQGCSMASLVPRHRVHPPLYVVLLKLKVPFWLMHFVGKH